MSLKISWIFWNLIFEWKFQRPTPTTVFGIFFKQFRLAQTVWGIKSLKLESILLRGGFYFRIKFPCDWIIKQSIKRQYSIWSVEIFNLKSFQVSVNWCENEQCEAFYDISRQNCVRFHARLNSSLVSKFNSFQTPKRIV